MAFLKRGVHRWLAKSVLQVKARVNRRRAIWLGLAASLIGIGGAAGVIAATTPASYAATASGNPGWIASVSANYPQNSPGTVTLPSSFSQANLLVAVVANDGPDSNTSETTAVFGGTPGLTWTRHAHISARQDYAVGGDQVDAYGASSAEIWTAVPPPGWTPGTVTEISNHPNTPDDGGVMTIAAFSNGQLGNIATLDGLDSRPEHRSMELSGAGSTIYAALFNGKKNAAFTPSSGYHTVVGRRAGDDTAQVIGSDSRTLGAGRQVIGYAPTPSPGDYWEEAIVEVIPAH
jgi:hypothetical protein